MPTDDGQDVLTGIALAKQGEVSRLQQWADANRNLDTADSHGWTALLWASARGHYECIKLLLGCGARSDLPHRVSGILPVHLAAQSGDVASVTVLLDHNPKQLNAVFDLNGHTPLLQAAFYGHLPLADMLLKRGADTSITTARGLGPMDLAKQFQNQPMMELLRPFDAPQAKKADYYKGYLARIAPVVPAGEQEIQRRSDDLVNVIQSGLVAVANSPASADETMAAVRRLVETEHADINRLGGPLQQPPLVVAATGNNGWPAVQAIADLREAIAFYLIDHGASPLRREEHPMGVQTVIRAAVFNHLTILKRCAQVLSAKDMADAINDYPLVNGLTALHDTVLRASMAGPDRIDGYLEQLRFLIGCGGRTDIEDYSGTTQRDIAVRTTDPKRRQQLLAIIDQAPQTASIS